MHIGDMLGKRYRLEERVDGGAMGEVWRGTDTRLNRTVAVKVLHASLSTSPAFRKRFAAEARAVAALRAPGIVDLYDYGEDTADDDTTVSYLVMEFVSGKALSAVIAERGRMSPGDVMAMIAQCAQALESAHKAGVIHRDIKPGNILIRDEGGIKVVDFGIARAHGESGLTSTGQVMGTVAYVSPEQLYDEDLSGASDIYSLGIVAYECLAGRKPFNADAPAAVIRAQLHEAPPPLPPEVPDSVAAVVMRCLEKSPKDRWASGAELARACKELAARLPQGDSTEPMDSPDEEDGATVRLATPAVTATRDMPAQDAPDSAGRAVPVGPDAKPASDDAAKRRKLAGIVLAAVLLLVLVTTVAWRPWEGSDAIDTEPQDEQHTTQQTKEDKTNVPTTQETNTWGDDYSWGETPSQPDSPEPTSGEPSTGGATSGKPTPTEPTEDPVTPSDDPVTSPDDGEEPNDNLPWGD